MDGAGWSIDHDGEMITESLRRNRKDISAVPRKFSGLLHNSIVHFGNIHLFIAHCNGTHSSNHIVVTFFHGSRDSDPDWEGKLRSLRALQPRIKKLVTSCSIMAQRLRDEGFPEDKMVTIPLGVNRSQFFPSHTDNQKADIRKRLGIPQDSICIGSFQKDGCNWGAGEDPKYVKGPDILVSVLGRLAREHNIHVVLTGPARGFVINGLKELGVSFSHAYVESHVLPDYYRCLDLYLVTSRDEGGPKAILEAMAAGIPLVSTRVGMACDIMQSEVNGMLADVDDVEGLYRACEKVLDDSDLRRKIVAGGLETSREFSWERVADIYYREVYSELLEKRD